LEELITPPTICNFLRSATLETINFIFGNLDLYLQIYRKQINKGKKLINSLFYNYLKFTVTVSKILSPINDAAVPKFTGLLL
jgi:hypothetical protein